MCQLFDVTPLEFDGRSDSILHPYDRKDRRHMEYLVDRGTYADVPVEKIIAKTSVLYVGDQIAIGRGDDTDVDLDGFASANRLDLSFLQCA